MGAPVASIRRWLGRAGATDARGHGQSERAPDYQYQHLAEDLSHVIEGTGVDRVALLGHSMGAATVALYAAQHARRVSCLILEDPPWRSAERTAQARQKRATAWRQQLEVEQRGSIAERLQVLQQLRPAWSAAERQACAEAEMCTDPAVMDLVAGATPDWRDMLAHIDCPSLLVCGDPARGAIVTPATAAEARQLLPDLDVETIAAGHTIRADNSVDYSRAVGRFLRQHVDAHTSTGV